MGKFSYSERFNNVKKYRSDGTYTGIQIASKLNQKNGQDYKLIDAVDIDWNKAWLNAAQTYVNTTDDLFDVIDKALDLGDLERINETLENIVATYVTKSELDEILSHYQKPLASGAHILIDDESYINAYGFITPEEGDEKYTYREEFDEFRHTIEENVYFKAETIAKIYELSYEVIQNQVIKGADELYDDLEKVSDWILAQQRYIPIDYEDIDLEGDIVYYIYDAEHNKYISVNKEYIQEHPDEQYYISSDVRDDLSDILNRLDYLDETVGYTYYDDVNSSYGYTGLLGQVDELDKKTDFLENKVSNMEIELTEQKIIVNESYHLSYTANINAYTAYNYAYETRLIVDEATTYSAYAYQMAYTAIVRVGEKHSYGYFVELTEDEKLILSEDPSYMTTYIFLNEGVPIESQFDPLLDIEYYKYIPEVEATGMYKDIDDIADVAYSALQSADYSLFRLHTQTTGSEYIEMNLVPDRNDGTNERTIVLNTIEADIDDISGLINQHGIITTYSLSDAFTYHSTIIDLEGDNKDINGLIYYDDNGQLIVKE